MIELIQGLIQRYANKGAFIDSNLLLLLMIGSVDKSMIPKSNRTRQYCVEDFHNLAELLSPFRILCTTPNVLTEVSNLGGNALKDKKKTQFFELLSEHIKIFDERYFPSKEICNSETFIKFGLTDSVLIRLGTQGILLISDDFPLVQYAQKAGVDTINFNYIRQYTLGQGR